jgi:hypothetical protein
LYGYLEEKAENKCAGGGAVSVSANATSCQFVMTKLMIQLVNFFSLLTLTHSTKLATLPPDGTISHSNPGKISGHSCNRLRLYTMANSRFLKTLRKYPRLMKVTPGAIADSMTVKSIHLPFPQTAFLLKYAPHHAYTFTSSIILKDPTRAFHDYHKANWAARTDPLWICFNCANFSTTAGIKIGRTVKSWLARRLRIAYAASMAKNGYETDGRTLDGTKKDISGTVMFMGMGPMVSMKQDEVQTQMDKAVHQVINLSNGRPMHEGSGYTKPLKVKKSKEG